MARPQINIDRKIFENACELQCTQAEIARLFGCSIDTIERWCRRVYNRAITIFFIVEQKVTILEGQFLHLFWQQRICWESSNILSRL